jgi:hypothetical protein
MEKYCVIEVKDNRYALNIEKSLNECRTQHRCLVVDIYNIELAYPFDQSHPLVQGFRSQVDFAGGVSRLTQQRMQFFASEGLKDYLGAKLFEQRSPLFDSVSLPRGAIMRV